MKKICCCASVLFIVAMLGGPGSDILVPSANAQLSNLLSGGLTLTENTTVRGKTSTATSYFSGEASRHSSADGTDTIVRFDQEKFITIDNKKKTYSEITFQEMQKMLDDATAALAQDEEAMAAMKKMMGGMSSEITVTKQGPGDTIAGYATEKYEVSGPFAMEIWAAPDLKVPSSYYDAMKMRIPSNPVLDMRKMFDAYKQINGWPMKTIMKVKMMGMSMETTTEVTSVQKGAVPSSMFEVPAGYKLVKEKF